jgi:hypothetical protein
MCDSLAVDDDCVVDSTAVDSVDSHFVEDFETKDPFTKSKRRKGGKTTAKRGPGALPRSRGSGFEGMIYV